MNKKIKEILLISLVAITIIIICGLFAVGNYFVDYALVSKSQDGSVNDDKAPQNSLNPIEIENKAKEDALVSPWLLETEIKEEHIVSTDGLSLYGKFFLQKKPSDKWVIAVHGYTSNSENLIRSARRFHAEGYNVLTPDLRAHGKSEGKYIGMGWTDKEDIKLWINYILNSNSNAQIVLYGRSMGGATVMMTGGDNLPKNVVAIVEDCGYTTAYDMFVEQLDFRFGLSEFPFMPVSSIVADMRAGYRFKDADALSQVKKINVPIMFIHGDLDNYVPVGMVYELYNAASTKKELLIIEGAEHSNAGEINPNLYYNSIFKFLENIIK